MLPCLQQIHVQWYESLYEEVSHSLDSSHAVAADALCCIPSFVHPKARQRNNCYQMQFMYEHASPGLFTNRPFALATLARRP